MSCLLRAGIGSEEEVAQDLTPDALGGSTRFGVYEIDCHADGSLCELGRGAMGVTYRATDTSLQRKVALKIIKTDIAERSADARERFMREARAAAALRHENIATIHQFGMRLETGQYFYAMELIEGETLEERVRRAGPLDARTTITDRTASHVGAGGGGKARISTPRFKAGKSDACPRLMQKRPTSRSNKKLLVKIIDFGLAKAIHTQTDPKSLTHDRFVGYTGIRQPWSNLNTLRSTCAPTSTHWAKRSGSRSLEKRHLEATASRKFTGHNNRKYFLSNTSKQHTFPLAYRSLLESMLALEPASPP